MFRQKIGLAFVLFSLTTTSFAGPGFTTINDVVYRIDGTPFEGSAIIEWSPLNAGGVSGAGMPVKTRIRHGRLKVRLANRGEGSAYYLVTYRAGEAEEFVETWAVPARSTALQVQDVRVLAPNRPQTAARATLQPLTATIPESSVINLVNDLASRPVEGASFAPGAAAIIDSTGAIDAAIGSPTNCVLVDGSSGPCGIATYPGAGVPNSTGSAWGTSYTVGTAANNLVQLNSSSQIPAVSAALLTNFPTFNQSTTGNAATATSLAAGAAGSLDYQSAVGVTAYLPATGYGALVSGAANPAWAVPTANGQCLMSAPSAFGTTSPSFQICPSGGGITQLTGDVTTASGSGAQTATVKYVNGSLVLGADSTVATNLFIGGGGTSVSTGGANTAFGDLALTPVSSGAYNTAVGLQALYNNNTGSSNTAVGYKAGAGANGNTTGSNNTYIGSQAAAGNSTQYSYQTIIGSGATATCNSCVVLGRSTDSVQTPGIVNFTASVHTLPAQAGLGASKPATCTVGEQYFATDATAGQNLFGCTAANTWTAESAGGSGAVSSVFGRTGAVTAQTGDYSFSQISGTASTLQIPLLNQNTTGTAAGLNGVLMSWLTTGLLKNTTGTGALSIAASSDVTSALGFTPATYPGAGVPNSTGSAWGTSYTVGTAANNLVQLNSSSQLPAVSAALLTNFPTFNQSTAGNAATATSLAAGAAGSLDYQSAVGVTAYLPATGYGALVSGAANPAWAAPTANGQCLMSAPSAFATTSPSFQICPSGGGITQLTGDVTTASGSGAQSATVKYVNGSLVLGADSTVATNLFIGGGGTSVSTGGANTALGDLALNPVSSGAYNSAFGLEALYNDNTGSYNTAIGYLAGAGSHGNTTGSNNTYIGAQAAAGNSTQYTYQTIIGSGATATCNSCVVVGRSTDTVQTPGTVNFTASAHTLPAQAGLEASMPATCTVGEQYFATDATAGQNLFGCTAANTWTAESGSGTGGSGAVSSVFGRTGVVTAQSGDYSFGQISGTVASGQLPVAGGDLTGTLTTATVKAIQGQPVSSTIPSNGQALVWNSAAGAWLPSNVSGSGATMAYQLGDLAVTRTSSTVLTIGAGCTSTSPCNVRFGTQVYSITNSATATISGNGTGTAYVYVNGSGIVMVGHNLTVACSAGCLQQSGITSFPPNVLPVYTWTANTGTWNNPGGADQRAFLSSKTLAAGQGIVITEAPGQTTISAIGSPSLGLGLLAANLPACNSGTQGLLLAVTDAATPAWHSAVTGTGVAAGYSPVFCNGTAWLYL